MKTLKYKYIALVLSIAVISCSEESTDDVPSINPDAQSIVEYINSLDYNPQDLLNVQDTGFEPSVRIPGIPDIDINPPSQGQIETCTTIDYDLFSNFESIAILRPNLDAVYPGALVIGDGLMLFGTPTPLPANRAPATMRLDLPGIGEQGTLVVENPSSNADVNAQLDNALEWWNTNNTQYPDGDGYVNEGNSTYDAAELYSSTQLSMDVGLNIAWADNSVASQLQFDSSSENKVATMVFKQVFYDVIMDTPLDASAVFRNDVTLEQVQSIVDSNRPPAYVSTVSYGRIIMLRLETTYDETNVEFDAVLEYAAGVDVNATIDSEMSDVLKTSSIKILTLGGNAEVAVSSVDLVYNDDEDISPGVLNDIITGENALYSRDNPGVPIAYTIRYLKDNTLAKMGYSTDYTTVECGRMDFTHSAIKVVNDFEIRNMRVRLSYKQRNVEGNIENIIESWVTVTDEDQDFFTAPAGSWDVEVEIEYFDLIGGFWEPLVSQTLGYVGSQVCYRGYNPSGWENIAWDNSCN
ncbi:thiol-activated cytolysin family protein [Winogradskyella sp. 3972H.M.0a.05]|uniref:thiol-activated cytolysin family protein n=1 Tax=Winogradskyella sp. 3972H.M.0a.05 TaxID=2950277 RepID=UPI003398A973